MGRYLAEATKHVEKIKHYHNHGGSSGYSEAVYDYNKLCGLIDRAYRSHNRSDKAEAPIICELAKSAGALMAEMKDRGEKAGADTHG